MFRWIELSSPRVALVGSLFDSPPVLAAAKAHSVSTAQVLLRWATQRGLAVIPKSNSQKRLEENLNVTNFDLSDAEIQEISDLDMNLKFNVPTNVSLRCLVEWS